MSIKILAIESSCDETAAAIIECEGETTRIISSNVSSQVKLHAQWGGVVPNLAAREHVKNFPPVITKTLKEAGVNSTEIDLLSVVNGPGLIPALLTGLIFGKTLSYLWKKPLIGIHHIEGHIYANFIEKTKNENSSSLFKNNKKRPPFPALTLVVSGGHTQLIYMKDHLEYEIVGETLDDAAGEAFDKVARILDLGYPGGPAISAEAEKFKMLKPNSKINSNAKDNSDFEIKFPRPMIKSKDLNFSFSGLKTAVLYETKKLKDKLSTAEYELLIPEICYEFQEAVTDVLIKKTMKAVEKYSPRSVMLAGGVSANKQLRENLGHAIEAANLEIEYLTPDLSLTGDNAAMIGAAACFKWKKMNKEERDNAVDEWKNLKANANLKIG